MKVFDLVELEKAMKELIGNGIDLVRAGDRDSDPRCIKAQLQGDVENLFSKLREQVVEVSE